MTRPLGQPDLAAVGRLLDATLGPGYWSLDPSCVGALRVAEADGAIVGLASACITESASYVDGVGPVGLVREVAVDPGYRGRGVATRLVREVCAECARAGAATLATYAWVYAREGRAPLAGVLERLGFERRRRVEDFYGGFANDVPCAGCGELRCICCADVYARGADGLLSEVTR